MKKWAMSLIVTMVAAWFGGLICSAEAGMTARQIMEMVDARDDGDNMTADQEMILIDKNGHKRIRRMKAFSKDKGKDTLKLMFFMEPADVRGTGFLTYDYYLGERDDDQWLYLPELKKVKRIASSDKSSAFMGSDFSYADMTKRVVAKWNYKLLKTMDIGGKSCWLIEATPVNDEVEDRYGYEKSVLFVRQDIFMVVRGVNWCKEGGEIKYLENVTIEQIDGVWVSTQTKAKTTRNGRVMHQTIFNQRNTRFGQDIKEEFFSTRQLEKGL
ncbi:outer membrane lipoprotein-sorting protein [Desulfarculus baarsii]